MTPKEILVVEALVKDQPPLNEIQRRAFRSRFSDEHCDDLGTRTQSLAVLRDGMEAAAAVARAIDDPKLRYGRDRFAWLLECTLALHAARQEQLRAQGKIGKLVDAIALAREEGIAARDALLEPLEQLAGETESAALVRARGVVRPDSALVDSLTSLADLARQWLARTEKDEVDAYLVGSAKLDASLIRAAMEAAAAIEQAGAGKPIAGRQSSRDTPPVNRAEGRVLEELRVAMKALEAAKRAGAAITLWVPGRGTRNVLGKRRKEQPDAQPAPADSTAATSGGDASAAAATPARRRRRARGRR